MENSTGTSGDANSHQRIRVGVGGWTYEPWRNNFFPPGLAHSKELHYASRQFTAIEVNGTARAYPIRGMSYHHIVNDTVAGVPIVATY